MTEQRKMNENSLANLKPFEPGQSGNPAGRPRKIYTVLKEQGYSADDIKVAFGELVFYTLPDLKAVFEDNSKPVIVRIVANQLFAALKKADWGKIKDMLEYILGRPAQEVKWDGTVQTRDLDFYDYYIKAQEQDDSKQRPTG